MEVSGRLPFSKRLAIRGTLGREHGAFASYRRNRNWSAGADHEVAGVTLAADWVGTSHSGAGRLGRDALVLSATRAF